MKMKRLLTFTALLASSFANAIDLNNYYAGASFTLYNGSSGSANLVGGYNYKEDAKIELELSSRSLSRFNSMVNFRYYPKISSDLPFALYVTGGIGGTILITKVESSGSNGAIAVPVVKESNAQNIPEGKDSKAPTEHDEHKVNNGNVATKNENASTKAKGNNKPKDGKIGKDEDTGTNEKREEVAASPTVPAVYSSSPSSNTGSSSVSFWPGYHVKLGIDYALTPVINASVSLRLIGKVTDPFNNIGRGIELGITYSF